MHRETAVSTVLSLALAAALTVSALTARPVAEAHGTAADGAWSPADALAGRQQHRALGRAKSLVIGVDGLTFSSITAARAPAIDGLRRTGTSARTQLYAEPMAPTLSGPAGRAS